MSPISSGRLGVTLTAITLTALCIWIFGRAIDVFLLLFIAVLISLFLGALSDVLVRRLRVPQRLGFVLALSATLVALGGLFALLVPPVVSQTGELLTVLPTYVPGWERSIDTFILRFPGMNAYWHAGQHQFLRALYDQAVGFIEAFAPRVFSVFGLLVDVFSVLVMSIYLTLQPGIYREWIIALFPPRHRDLVRDILHDVADSLRAYIVGQFTTMSFLAAITAIGLYVLRVPYWLAFGVFTGLSSIIPFFGSLLSTLVPAAFVLVGPQGWSRALLVIGLGIVVHIIEGNVVSPLVMSRKVELPPILTIVAVLIIGRVLSPLGLVVAVPTLAMLMVIVRRILIDRVYEGKGFRKADRERKMLLRVPVPNGGVLLPAGPPVDVVAFRAKVLNHPKAP